jgi:hypothetical protein
MTRSVLEPGSGGPNSTGVDFRSPDHGIKGPNSTGGDFWPGPLRRRLAVLLGLPQPGSR